MNKVTLSFQSIDRLITYHKVVVEFEELTQDDVRFISSIASSHRYFGKTQWVHITYENSSIDSYKPVVYTKDCLELSVEELEYSLKDVHNDMKKILGAMQNG